MDQIAMLAALESGGSVLAVVADSLIKAPVSGKYRAGIREKRLVMVSPFYPDARFHVGNAMGRNKSIYALADFALIISAEVRKGGTWAGAAEELKRSRPRPVFVRDENSAPQGNFDLIQLGALPFPRPPWGNDLMAILTDRAGARTKGEHTQMPLFAEPSVNRPVAAGIKEKTQPFSADSTNMPAVESIAVKDDLREQQSVYEAVLPILLKTMVDWCSSADMADALERIFPQATRAGQYRHPGPALLKHCQEDLDESLEEALNTAGHLQSSLLGRSESIAIIDGKLELGQFGQIYFIDFDTVRPRDRTVRFQIMGT